MTGNHETRTPEDPPPQAPESAVDRKRREIERGVFERRRPPEAPAPKPGRQAAGACGRADDTEAHPS